MGRAPYMSAKGGVGALSTVAIFNHERAPMSYLQQLEALEANTWTQNNIQRNHQHLRSRVLTAQNTLLLTALAMSFYTKIPCINFT